MLRWLPVMAILAYAACASEPRGPYFGDERFLMLGVDPEREAQALVEQLERNGFSLERRLVGKHFTALGFAEAGGEPGPVRVLTVRGIALALDTTEGDPLTQEVRHRLLEAPMSSTHDADGDGFEEVFVERLVGPSRDACVLVYRVRDSGFVDPVASKGFALAGPADSAHPRWLEPHLCEVRGRGGTPDAGVEAPDGGVAAPSPGGP
ncbi:MAG: hypothetical protein PVI30_26260 [Myxococcales bacterium]|jgi:hypothetical protein